MDLNIQLPTFSIFASSNIGYYLCVHKSFLPVIGNILYWFMLMLMLNRLFFMNENPQQHAAWLMSSCEDEMFMSWEEKVRAMWEKHKRHNSLAKSIQGLINADYFPLGNQLRGSTSIWFCLPKAALILTLYEGKEPKRAGLWLVVWVISVPVHPYYS